MLKKFSGYILISLFSFGLFTAAFHAVAHAQTGTQSEVRIPTPTQGAKLEITFQPTATKTPLNLSPTPTIFVLITTTPTNTPLANPTKTPTPNNKSSVATTASPSPTTSPKITSTPIPSATPASAPQINEGGLDAEKLFSMTNTHRQAKGLPALQKDERTCSLAAARAPEIVGELAAGTLHSGMYERNLPYWNTENAIALPSEEAAFNWWLNDSIHRQAIEGNHTHSCVSCSGIYCVQEFTSYQPK